MPLTDDAPPNVRVALLECDHVSDALRHAGDDYGQMFTARFAEHAPWVDLERFDIIGGDALPAPGAHDAYLITGSRHSVTDEFAWLSRLGDFLESAVERELPTVGICFGHQLLAHRLGGQVERAASGWGVGIHEARVETTLPWMTPPLDRFRLIVSHQDQVVELPQSATLIASSEHAPIAAFQVGSAVGFQGHPEFDPRYSAALMHARRDRIPADVIDAGEASLNVPADHGPVTAWLGAFLAGHRTPLPAAGSSDVSTSTV